MITWACQDVNHFLLDFLGEFRIVLDNGTEGKPENTAELLVTKEPGLINHKISIKGLCYIIVEGHKAKDGFLLYIEGITITHRPKHAGYATPGNRLLPDRQAWTVPVPYGGR